MCTHYGVFKKDEKVVCPVDETGCFTSEVTHFKGQYMKVIIISCVYVVLIFLLGFKRVI